MILVPTVSVIADSPTIFPHASNLLQAQVRSKGNRTRKFMFMCLFLA